MIRVSRGPMCSLFYGAQRVQNHVGVFAAEGFCKTGPDYAEILLRERFRKGTHLDVGDCFAVVGGAWLGVPSGRSAP
eukprot:2556919-Lingulodinium_polyedra.AAC.1